MKQWQRYAAEFLGTGTLVFVGTSALAGLFVSGIGSAQLIAPFAFGIGLLAALYAFGEVSGGHFNPAVSLGMFLDRRINVRDLVGYWISQFAGAIGASLVLLIATRKQHDVKVTTTVPLHGDGAAFVMEIAMTALFVAVILQVTKTKAYGSTTFVAIALTLLAVHFAAVPWSGASVNPARSLGPALVGNRWTSFWIYIIAPPIGAILGWIGHSVAVKGDTNLRDDFERVKGDITGGMGGPSQPPA